MAQRKTNGGQRRGDTWRNAIGPRGTRDVDAAAERDARARDVTVGLGRARLLVPRRDPRAQHGPSRGRRDRPHRTSPMNASRSRLNRTGKKMREGKRGLEEGE